MQEKRYRMDKMKEIKDYIKCNKIPYAYLEECMGYSARHICYVLNEKKRCTPQFERLLNMALKRWTTTERKIKKEIAKCIPHSFTFNQEGSIYE